MSNPSADSTEMPVFPGVGSVIDLVRKLVRRPRLGEVPLEERVGRRRSRRRGIPMVCFVRDRDQPLLPALAAGYLHTARPGRIPHALYSLPDDSLLDLAPGDAVPPPTAGDVSKVRDILFALSRELGSGRNSRFGRTRFHQFGLVYWLMDQPLTAESKDPDRLLRERLRERDIMARPDERILAATAEGVSSVVAIPAWFRRLLAVVPPLWFSLKVSGRLPLVGRSYRWFLKGQPNLAPQDPGTFIGFAERLTRDNYPKEDPEQVMRLLVNAFLEDLRRAYGRWIWRLGGARRMTYAVVLLDCITRANGGYRLLKLINDVRNETGAFDPLLVISGSQKVPPYAVEPGVTNPDDGVRDAADADEGYEAWRHQFSRDSRRRAPTAWYLPIRIPDPGPDPGTLVGEARQEAYRRQGRARQELAAMGDFIIDRPPLWSRRWVPGLAVLALTATLAVTGFGYRQRHSDYRLDYQQHHCGELPGSPGADWLMMMDSECIGVSDGSHVFQPTNLLLDAVEQKVHEQNVAAVAQHQVSPGRPYLTLIYVATLTSTTSDLVTARERLEGVAVAQARQLDLRGPNEPIVRVLMANGGASMRHGPDMARLIVRMAASDPGIVGIVGLDQSRKPTIDVIDTLTKAGLPMVAATLSADNLVKLSPLYFQVSPQDIREAEVAASYAKARFGVDRVRIMVSADPEDAYSDNLSEDAARTFGAAGFAAETVKFNPQGMHLPFPSAKGTAENACGYSGVVFFAGRQEDFAELLNGFYTQCRDSPPRIVGGDDVAKYVADRKMREGLYSDIPYDYLSFAVGSGSRCGNDVVYRKLRALFPQECGKDRDPSLDGAMELAYDAALAMIKAGTHLRQDHPIPITAGGLWHELSQLQLDGESGRIDFRKGQVPPKKPVAVLRVQGGQVRMQGFCGELRNQRPADWCPPGS
jgi:ABC-type branched-subunit amino acid transport system substrate-binding protein